MRIRQATTLIGTVMIVVYIVFLIFMWDRIPDTVATHFNAAGEADAYGSKISLIIEPVMMVILFLILSLVERVPSLWNFPVKLTDENKDRLFAIGIAMLGFMKILVLGLLIVAGLSCIFPGFPVWPLYTLITLIVCVIAGGIIECVRMR